MADTFSVGTSVRFHPSASNVRTDLRDKDLIVRSVSKDGSRIFFSPKGSKKDAKPNSTTPDRLVPAVAPKDRSVYLDMKQRFGLKDNDIFITPKCVYDFIQCMTDGIFSEDIFMDPCPDDYRFGEDWNGLTCGVGAWHSVGQSVFAYVNPPFSLTYEWIEKSLQELERGGMQEIVMLINSADYFVVEGRERSAKWETFRSRAHFELLSSNQYVAGCCHKWFRWGENMITGKETGGSMFGVTIFRMTTGAGESVKPVTPEAAEVILDYRDRNVKAPVALTMAQLKAQNVALQERIKMLEATKHAAPRTSGLSVDEKIVQQEQLVRRLSDESEDAEQDEQTAQKLQNFFDAQEHFVKGVPTVKRTSVQRAQEMSAGGAKREERFKKQEAYAAKKAHERKQKMKKIIHDHEVATIQAQMKAQISEHYPEPEDVEDTRPYESVIINGMGYMRLKGSD